MAVDNLIDLYTDYLIACPGQATGTNLSECLDGALSHDKFTRMLSGGAINSTALWQLVKPLAHEIRSNEGVLIIDDSIQEKRYTDESELICWHFDHTRGRSVKGVNFISALYHSQGTSLPVGVDFVLKDKTVINNKGKLVRKSSKSKNEHFRELVKQAHKNVDFVHVLADSWYCTTENMKFIVNDIKSHFIMAMKENRKIALSEEDKKAGRYLSINKSELEGRTLSVYIEQMDTPLLITKQVFKNGDGSTGALYLATDDLNLTYQQITTIYKKRWKVEQFHQSIKSNAGFAKSPTKRVQTQKSHFVASIMAFVKMESLSIRRNETHHALKMRLLLKASKAAMTHLTQLSTP